MKYNLLEKLACPFDKNDLSLKAYVVKGDVIIEGLLTCEKCARYYPVVQGVPILSPDEYREALLEQPLLKRWGIDLPKEVKFKLLN